MKVLLVSEGKHERGTNEAGALANLVGHLLNGKVSLDWDWVKASTVRVHPVKGQGYYKRAVRWILEAKKRGYDGLVLVIDQDGRREREDEIQRAQESQLSILPRALGVAIRSFDAWMLADEAALTAVLGEPVQRQKDPEELRDPKAICTRLLDASKCELGQGEMYAAIAAALQIGFLEARCPRGFGAFAKRVRGMFRQD